MRKMIANIILATSAMVSIATMAKSQFSAEAGEVLVMVNELRMAGATCSGTGTVWGPTDPLIPTENLFISAHGWSINMVQTGNATHSGFFRRINNACPNPGVIAENIAADGAAVGAVLRWMSSPSGHCEAIMNPNFKFIGVGMAPDGEFDAYWTVQFAQSC